MDACEVPPFVEAKVAEVRAARVAAGGGEEELGPVQFTMAPFPGSPGKCVALVFWTDLRAPSQTKIFVATYPAPRGFPIAEGLLEWDRLLSGASGPVVDPVPFPVSPSAGAFAIRTHARLLDVRVQGVESRFDLVVDVGSNSLRSVLTRTTAEVGPRIVGNNLSVDPDSTQGFEKTEDLYILRDSTNGGFRDILVRHYVTRGEAIAANRRLVKQVSYRWDGVQYVEAPSPPAPLPGGEGRKETPR